MSKWLPTNKWITAQSVLLTALAEYGFDNGINTALWKGATIWLIQAIGTYFTSNKRLPDETT